MPARAKGIYNKGLPTKKKRTWYKTYKNIGLSGHELVMIDGVTVKDKEVIIPPQLQMQILKQLHSNHIGIEKTRLLEHESMYWVNMNVM